MIADDRIVGRAFLPDRGKRERLLYKTDEMFI
jgi:hypothetical protein